MDWNTLKEKALALVSKYKYICLVLLAGIILMSIPPKSESENTATEPALTYTEESLSDKLAQILTQIEGVGKTRVLLTEAGGEETVYQTDEDVSSDGSVRSETVIITGEGRGQTGLVRTVTPPVYLGAIVVCQGADSASVRLAVVQAVSNVTGIPSDRITVLKMK